MRNVKILEDMLSTGMRSVTLENDKLTVVVLPDNGADIYSVEYKPKNRVNVLFQSPSGPRRLPTIFDSGNSEEQWMDRYYGGWNYMFPNMGAACSYKGASMGFHGEASVVPWQYELVEEEEGVSLRLTTTLLRTPFILEKTISLGIGADSFLIHDRITNYSEVSVDYIWGQHIAFGAPLLGGGSRLTVPSDKLEVEPFPEGSDLSACRIPAGIQGWPIVKDFDGKDIDLSKMPPENNRSADMSYLTGMREGWYELVNDELGLGARVEWDLEAYPYVWLWQEFKGTLTYPFYGSYYVMGVEPSSTPLSGGLEAAVKGGYARQLGPKESHETSTSMRLFER
ncbi:DUF4432 family protein [Cohnella sp. GCM10020058]|uniref:DUF4432 family protein n=1 Tax=Cohnella sp. GCM10020058 TaxID=3317330 RepID=UPI00362EBD60